MRKLLILILLTFACKNDYDCNYKSDNNVQYVSFELYSYWKYDQYKVILDNGKYTWISKKFTKDFFTDFKNRRFFIVRYYCTISDSIKVYFSYNDICDTTFFLSSKEVSTCYLNRDLENKIHIQYFYKNKINIIEND